MALRIGRNIPSTNKLKLIIINLCYVIIICYMVLVTSLESSFGFDLKWNFTCFYFKSTRSFNRLFNVWISKRATTLIPKANIFLYIDAISSWDYSIRTYYHKWVKVLKNEPSKISGRQPSKNLKWYGLPDHITLNVLKAVFHKFYLVHSWISWPESSAKTSVCSLVKNIISWLRKPRCWIQA